MRRWLLIFLVLLLLVIFVFRRPLLVRIGHYPIVASELHSADLIVVISGALPEIHYGVDLYKAGYAPKLLFVGHHPVQLAVLHAEPFQVVEKPWDYVAGEVAINAGVPRAAILYSDAFMESTYERVQNFIRVAEQNNLHRLIVISDPLHSRRIAQSAAEIYRKEYASSPHEIISTPLPQQYVPTAYRFDPNSWWQREDSLKEVFSEYIKLAFYLFKYK
jgi:uncharacterized SAM-binding protein YcdF (DUF218 family)